jgi:predicted signal transduction protein with EAL and GGDEF domain
MKTVADSGRLGQNMRNAEASPMPDTRTLSSGTGDMPLSDPNTTLMETVSNEARKLDLRELQLWSMSAIIMIVLTTGLGLLIFPSISSGSGRVTIETDIRYVPQVLSGLIVLILLFNVYVLKQTRTIWKLRQDLMSEIASRKQAERLSLIDPLTKVYNRRYLEEVLPKDLSRFARAQRAACFAMFDLNNFKTANATLGHVTADVLLSEFAGMLRSSVRAADVIVRYGGDEFLERVS